MDGWYKAWIHRLCGMRCHICELTIKWVRAQHGADALLPQPLLTIQQIINYDETTLDINVLLIQCSGTKKGFLTLEGYKNRFWCLLSEPNTLLRYWPQWAGRPFR
mmetsp:Transcript_28354/g.72882  ORF Transcript_28354/g.72882 Transcript_28354/m.72882 type:complete len:105 (+) Transcript_28354:106-420(+)